MVLWTGSCYGTGRYKICTSNPKMSRLCATNHPLAVVLACRREAARPPVIFPFPRDHQTDRRWIDAPVSAAGWTGTWRSVPVTAAWTGSNPHITHRTAGRKLDCGPSLHGRINMFCCCCLPVCRQTWQSNQGPGPSLHRAYSHGACSQVPPHDRRRGGWALCAMRPRAGWPGLT